MCDFFFISLRKPEPIFRTSFCLVCNSLQLSTVSSQPESVGTWKDETVSLKEMFKSDPEHHPKTSLKQETVASEAPLQLRLSNGSSIQNSRPSNWIHHDLRKGLSPSGRSSCDRVGCWVVHSPDLDSLSISDVLKSRRNTKNIRVFYVLYYHSCCRCLINQVWTCSTDIGEFIHQ